MSLNKNSITLCGLSLILASSTVLAKGKPTVENILPHTHTCSNSLKFRAQDMTYSQFENSCYVLAQQEDYFHQKLSTQRLPVDNDLNEDLRMVVFDDYRNYNRYGARFFNISTNNGGIYIEGDATNPENQASFYAHEADWLRPEFAIWNLAHEYVHYLDGRFDLKGNFSDYPTNTVWWSEGLAEYISLKDNNADAVALISGSGSNRSLSAVFNTNYSHTSDEIYRWGYLGVRFMFENNLSDIDMLRSLTRNADWQSYQNELNQWAVQYEGQWQSWLINLKNG